MDEVVFTGNTGLEFILLLRSYGLEVRDLFVYIDCEGGGVEALERIGVFTHAIWKDSELLYFWKRVGLLSQAKYDLAMAKKEKERQEYCDLL